MFKLIKSIFNKNNKSETKKNIIASYNRPPSISNKLPWMEYDPQNKCFLLDDGKSVGAVFELADVASEARPDSFLEQLQKGLQGLFQDVFPQYFDNESPWIIQFFVQDELNLKSPAEAFKNYIKPAARNSKFSNEYLKLISEHFNLLSQPQGLFVDTKVSGLPFCGRQRKIRAGVTYLCVIHMSLIKVVYCAVAICLEYNYQSYYRFMADNVVPSILLLHFITEVVNHFNRRRKLSS